MYRIMSCDISARPLRWAFFAFLIFASVEGFGYHFTTITTSTSSTSAVSRLSMRSSSNDNDGDYSNKSPIDVYNMPMPPQPSKQRRRIIRQSSSTMIHAVIAAILLPFAPPPTFAVEEDDSTSSRQPAEPYTRTSSPNDKFKFSYTVTPPPTFVPGNKPLKTHLDEINFSPEPSIRGYTLGITVDPVRINSIKEFGSPDEIAAKVVTAEVNRDGVFKVTLAKDPIEDKDAGCYDIEYISDGKRGTKYITNRIYVQDGFLFVLTAQSKVDEYDKEREADVMTCVKSFKPL